MAITASLGVRINTNKLLENRFKSRSLLTNKQSVVVFLFLTRLLHSHSISVTSKLVPKQSKREGKKHPQNTLNLYRTPTTDRQTHIIEVHFFFSSESWSFRSTWATFEIGPQSVTLMDACMGFVCVCEKCFSEWMALQTEYAEADSVRFNIYFFLTLLGAACCSGLLKCVWIFAKRKKLRGRVKTKTAYFENVFHVIHPVCQHKHTHAEGKAHAKCEEWGRKIRAYKAIY